MLAQLRLKKKLKAQSAQISEPTVEEESNPIQNCESLCQNNECPVESIISIFSSQTFRGQHEDTAENRSFIKINGDSIAGSEDFCSALAKMSVQGITDWGINPLALPICYGCYENPIAKHFKTIQSQTGKKFDYMYKCQGEAFTLRMNAIANEFQEVRLQFNTDDMTD